MKAFVSWSGGKETALSLYKAPEDVDPCYLLNMGSKNGERSHSHGIKSKVLMQQSKAIDIPLVQRKTSWGNYEEKFKESITEMKKENVEAGIFGDIDIQGHREWVERICEETGINPILPLWNEKRENILEDFIDSGFKAIVVSAQADYEELLGREIDAEFLEDLKKLKDSDKDFDLCGERGEYHTFSFDGPIFRNPLEIKTKEKIFGEENCLLEISVGSN